MEYRRPILQEMDTRKVGLTLTYRFHKIKERENQTSAEVEMKRLGIPEE